ncbi:MAG TPA: inner membrane-spanning protein YciB [Steroidobacteraceae bacterium]|nr:inner membrane-spanning protein YciB [Steroidobacteraceae bacterium]
MPTLLELLPLVAFLGLYYARGMYAATAGLMVAMGLLLGIDLVRTRRIPPMHALSAALVFAFGAATLVLHNHRFIEWKPTVFFWLVSAAFLASFRLGERTLVERLLAPAFGPQACVPERLWRRLNWLWVAFYGALGLLNLAIAYRASERTWVNFKVFGLTLLTAAFIAAQLLWLARRVQPAPDSSAAA